VPSPQGVTWPTASAIDSSAGSITITGGGGGYTSLPTVTFTNAAGDTTGSGATAVANVRPRHQGRDEHYGHEWWQRLHERPDDSDRGLAAASGATAVIANLAKFLTGGNATALRLPAAARAVLRHGSSGWRHHTGRADVEQSEARHLPDRIGNASLDSGADGSLWHLGGHVPRRLDASAGLSRRRSFGVRRRTYSSHKCHDH